MKFYFNLPGRPVFTVETLAVKEFDSFPTDGVFHCCWRTGDDLKG